MHHIISLSQLSSVQLRQYHHIIEEAFPLFIHASPVVRAGFPKVEKYFPQYQRILTNTENEVLAIINMIPYHWSKSISELPITGWDWLMERGISDYEKSIAPNQLGGLQIIVNKNHLGQGYSKVMIAEGKAMMLRNGLSNLTIPIRPILKHSQPHIPMKEYMDHRLKDKIYDPWIRTHINSGAKIIKVCEKSMTIKGDINFWNKLTNQKINQSGSLKIDGGLNLLNVNIDKDEAIYQEENIWLYYHNEI